MSLKITRMPEKAAILLQLESPMDPLMVARKNLQETAALKEELGRPVYRIIDLSILDLAFSDMMAAMGAERNHPGGSGDPDVTTCFIGSGELVKLGTKALAEQDQYGKGRVKLFVSVEDALAFIDKDMAE